MRRLAKARHDLAPGTHVRVYLTDEPACDLGLPVYSLNYNHAIREIRLNAAETWVQASYADKETYDDADFVNKIQVGECEESEAP
jgi:hypothetical protein